jgi:lipopolysaccharide transport system permease protein
MLGTKTKNSEVSTQRSDITVIRPSKGWVSLGLREVWQYRELFYFLIWRDVKIRYKQTAIGGLWAVIQPLGMMVVFSLLFGLLLNAPSQDIPYPIFTYAALLPWQLFVMGIQTSGISLVKDRALITKVYFPRIISPSAGVLVGLVEFCAAFVILIGMMFFFGIVPTWATATLPLLLILLLATALGVGLWLSALNAMYRDIEHTISFLVQMWLFITPVAYSSTLIPERWRILYSLNPMTGVVEGFRWALLGTQMPSWPAMSVSVVVVMVLLVGGLFYFRRVERVFADVV